MDRLPAGGEVKLSKQHGVASYNKAPKGAVREWIIQVALNADPGPCVTPPCGASRQHFVHEGVWWRGSHFVLVESGLPRPPAPYDHALHSCDEPRCLNPHHLRWGSNADNVNDRVSRDRTTKGEEVGWARLTEQQVREIRLLKSESSYSTLSALYGVHPQTIAAVCQRRSWGWVE